MSGIETRKLYFPSDTFVYTGSLTAPWPACTTVSETCKPYTYDASTNTLTIDSKPATLSDRSITLGGDTYLALGVPTTGARWQTVLAYVNSWGMCTLYCSSVKDYLAFRLDGTFIRGVSAANSSTGSGGDDYWSTVADDNKGTYEIRADHTLLLAYADGTQSIRTLGIYPAKDGSYPDNPASGIVLDGTGYFEPSD
jgi:hypothetical protein